MQRLTMLDALDQIVVAMPFTDDYPVDRLQGFARREAAVQVRHGGRVRWSITDHAGTERATGELAAEAPAGLLPVHTPVLYAEADAEAPLLSVFGTIRRVEAGHYVLAVDHVDSGGTPVPVISLIAEVRVPVDTPAEGGPRTLSALPMALAVAAE